MNCDRKGCKGKIIINGDEVPWMRNVNSIHFYNLNDKEVYPCDKCGLLHDLDGKAVKNNKGENAIVLLGGGIIEVPEKSIELILKYNK